MKNSIDKFLKETKYQIDLLTVVSVYIAINLRNLLLQKEFFYYDFTQICDLNLIEDIDQIVNRKYFHESFSKIIKNEKFQIEISDIKKEKLEHESPLTIIFRMDISSLFDGYEEGYLMPFYTMLHFKTTFETDDDFYKFINNSTLMLEYCELNGFTLIQKANTEKLITFTNEIRNEIVMCMLNG